MVFKSHVAVFFPKQASFLLFFTFFNFIIKPMNTNQTLQIRPKSMNFKFFKFYLSCQNFSNFMHGIGIWKLE